MPRTFACVDVYRNTPVQISPSSCFPSNKRSPVVIPVVSFLQHFFSSPGYCVSCQPCRPSWSFSSAFLKSGFSRNQSLRWLMVEHPGCSWGRQSIVSSSPSKGSLKSVADSSVSVFPLPGKSSKRRGRSEVFSHDRTVCNTH